MNKKPSYFPPLCEEYAARWEDILCVSGPENGGSEDIGYEDWVIS